VIGVVAVIGSITAILLLVRRIVTRRRLVGLLTPPAFSAPVDGSVVHGSGQPAGQVGSKMLESYFLVHIVRLWRRAKVVSAVCHAPRSTCIKQRHPCTCMAARRNMSMMTVHHWADIMSALCPSVDVIRPK